MKIPRRLPLAALLGVPPTLFFMARQASDKRPHKLGFHPACEYLRFSPDGHTLISTASSTDNTSHITLFWNVQNGHQLRGIRQKRNSGNPVAFSPEGKQVARFETSIKLLKDYELSTSTAVILSTIEGKSIKRFAPPQRRCTVDEYLRDHLINDIAWSSDGREIVMLEKRHVRRTSTRTGRILSYFPYRLTGDNEWATNSLSPDGTTIAYTEISPSKRQQVVLVDIRTNTRKAMPIRNVMSKVTFSQRSQLATINEGFDVHFLRVKDLKVLWTWKSLNSTNGQTSFHFANDEKSVVACNGSSCVARDAQNGHELWGAKSPISLIFALSPDGKTLAEARANGQILLWPLPQHSK